MKIYRSKNGMNSLYASPQFGCEDLIRHSGIKMEKLIPAKYDFGDKSNRWNLCICVGVALLGWFIEEMIRELIENSRVFVFPGGNATLKICEMDGKVFPFIRMLNRPMLKEILQQKYTLHAVIGRPFHARAKERKEKEFIKYYLIDEQL